MKVPDKIYVREFSDGLSQMWSSVLATETSAIEQHEYIRKDILLEWAEYQMSFEQGFETGEAERAYRFALKDLINHINTM